MGAIKAAIDDEFSTVLEQGIVEMNGDKVVMSCEFMGIFMNLLDGDSQLMHRLEHQWFNEYSVDTADFLADWGHAITAAVSIYGGLATTDDGLIGNSFAWMAYHYYLSPRRCAVAMQKMGLTDKAIQAIIYMLSGVILDQNDKLKIIKFNYLDEQ